MLKLLLEMAPLGSVAGNGERRPKVCGGSGLVAAAQFQLAHRGGAEGVSG
ncbi:MAG TPA: hypothetical protein VFS57_02170 [Gemmatimonadaceae bacterium]|nr:hypothetical protein [Gemmatimonadaceae bacterium]